MDQVPSFKFSFARTKEAEKDIDLQINAIETFLDKITRGVEINGHPVVGYILQLTHEEPDLKRLGEALIKVAPHIKKLDDLKRRKDLFELAAKEPHWLQWAFGDFEAELDQLTPESFTIEGS